LEAGERGGIADREPRSSYVPCVPLHLGERSDAISIR
jgi:hypothetical protein